MYNRTKIICKTLANVKCTNVHLFAKLNAKKMGAMHETIKAVTAKDIAKSEGVDIATIRFRWNAAFEKGTFDSNRELSPEEIAAISRNASTKRAATRKAAAKDIRTTQPATVNQPAPAKSDMTPAPGRAKFTWPSLHQVRRFFFNTLAIAVVCGHGFLIWQEAAELYGYIGSIGGAVIFAVVCLAVLIASDASRTRTSGSALWFMLFVDAAAGFVHYEALHTLSVPKAMTIGFCIFICASSFVALLLYRDSKLD